MAWYLWVAIFVSGWLAAALVLAWALVQIGRAADEREARMRRLIERRRLAEVREGELAD